MLAGGCLRPYSNVMLTRRVRYPGRKCKLELNSTQRFCLYGTLTLRTRGLCAASQS